MKLETITLRTTLRLFIGVTVVLATACSIKILRHKTDDGSTSLSASDSSFIRPFDIRTYSIAHNITGAADIFFEIGDAGKIDQIIPDHPVTWIMLGASWCPVSFLAYKKFARISREFSKDSLWLLIINQDFNISQLQQGIFEADYHYPTFLLDPGKYGKKESDKQKGFIKDLHLDLSETLFEGGGVPRSVIIDKNKEVKLVFTGIRINSDSIVKYTGLKKTGALMP